MDVDLSEARQVKSELVQRLGGERRFAGVGLTVDANGRPSVQVNRTNGPPLSVEPEIRGVPVLQAVVGRARAL